MGAAGKVRRRVDGKALEEGCVLGCEVLDGLDVVLEDGGRCLEGLAGERRGELTALKTIGATSTYRVGRGFEFMTLARRLERLLVSWTKRLRTSSSCLNSSGERLRDAMVAHQ